MIAAVAGTPQVPGVSLFREAFRADVLQGLRASRRAIPCKYFYDTAGSQLFEEICKLPEYYLTRTELGIMRRHAAEMAELLGPRCALIEYGSGSSLKTRLLLSRLVEPPAYVPVDISGEFLQASAVRLARRYPHVPVLPVCADFTKRFDLPQSSARPERRVVYFPGSTIGNFTPAEAIALLRRTASLCGPGGALLLGADLKKEPRIIEAAYDDARGVTAAFNLNLLVRINRELGGDFPGDGFWHHSFYSPRDSRIEMHLVSRGQQRVHVAGEQFDFAEGEAILTEYSYKYSLEDLRSLARAGGFEFQAAWTDAGRYFTVQCWQTL